MNSKIVPDTIQATPDFVYSRLYKNNRPLRNGYLRSLRTKVTKRSSPSTRKSSCFPLRDCGVATKYYHKHLKLSIRIKMRNAQRYTNGDHFATHRMLAKQKKNPVVG